MSTQNPSAGGHDAENALAKSARNTLSHLVIGKIVGCRGIRGELKVQIETDDPQRFMALREVFLGEDLAQFVVQRARIFKGQALLQLAGVDDRDSAEAWRGAYIRVAMQDALPLAPGEYYHYQIEGLDVVTDAGESLGAVSEVFATGANDVYVVRGPQGEILLPAVREVILKVDLDANQLTVHLPEGLL